MNTKFFFALLLTMLSVMPLEAKRTAAQDYDAQELVTKVFPKTKVYLYTRTGQTHIGEYYIVIDYIKENNKLIDVRWNYILRAPINSIFEVATDRCGGIERNEKEPPIDQFKKKFQKLNDMFDLKIVDVDVYFGIE